MTDDLLIGIDVWGICGDADGDGDEKHTSAALQAMNGVDVPLLGESESFSILVDFDLNVADVLPLPNDIVPWDFVVGIGANASTDCASGSSSSSSSSMCVGVFHLEPQLTVDHQKNTSLRFREVASTGQHRWLSGDLVTDVNPSPTLERPSLEWIVHNLTVLREQTQRTFELSNQEPWLFIAQVCFLL